jgi:hypothetical protein
MKLPRYIVQASSSKMLEFLSQHLTLTLILAGVPLPNNWENCQIAATLFQNQGGVKT